MIKRHTTVDVVGPKGTDIISRGSTFHGKPKTALEPSTEAGKSCGYPVSSHLHMFSQNMNGD